MLKKTKLFLACVLLCIGQIQAQYCPGNPPRNSSFDWTADSWPLWIRPVVTQVPVQVVVPSPFSLNTIASQPNTVHLQRASGAGDYLPEDGWVILVESVGMTRPDAVYFPQFVLYNRFESKMRYFVYLTDMVNASDVEVSAKFSLLSGVTHVSAALEHVFTPMKVIEHYRNNNILITIPNQGFSPPGVWAMADIAIAYDPCTCEYTSGIEISTTTKNYLTYDLNLVEENNVEEVIGLVNGQGNRVKNSGNRFSAVAGDSRAGFFKGNVAYKTMSEFMSVAEKLLIADANRKLTPAIASTLGNAGVVIPPTGLTPHHVQELFHLNNAEGTTLQVKRAIRQLFPDKIPDSLVPDWVKNATLFPKTTLPLLDFLVGGGKSTSPQPIHFDKDFFFEGSGQIVHKQAQTGVSFYIPGGNSTGQLSLPRVPFYNQTLGVLNLMEQPVLYIAEASPPETEIEVDIYPEIFNWFYSVKLASPLKFALNPASGLTLSEIKGAIYFDACVTGLESIITNDLPIPEGLVDEGGHVWRTPYLPLSCLEDYSVIFTPHALTYDGSLGRITFSCDDRNVQLHLIAKLTSQAGAETVWAARYRVNLTEAPFSYENTPANPYLVSGNLPDCGIPEPVSADWLAGFCQDKNRYNPIFSNSGLMEEEADRERAIQVSGAENQAKLSPNPVTQQALLDYTLETEGVISISVSDYAGRRVMEIQSQQWLDKGHYQLIIPAERLVAGMYFVTLVRREGIETLRLIKQ